MKHFTRNGSGGRGYIMKQEGADRILQSIRLVSSGQISVSAKMSVRLLDALSGRQAKNRSPISRLTDRELEIFQLIGRGKDSHIIAKQLSLSVKTVDTHRGHLKEKLELKNGTELICRAARWVATQAAGRILNRRAWERGSVEREAIVALATL